MTKFYMRWHLNPLTAPTDQEELAKLWMRMLEMVKADLKEGTLTGWGSCTDASAGYAFAETDEKSLYATILKWIPYVVFDIKPVLTVDECIEGIQRAAVGK